MDACPPVHAHLRHATILCGLIHPLGGIVSLYMLGVRRSYSSDMREGAKSDRGELREQEIQESIKEKLGDGAHSDAKQPLFCRGVSSCTFEGPFNPLGSISLNKHH